MEFLLFTAQSNSATSSPLHSLKRTESPLESLGAKAFNDVLQMLEEERVNLETQLEKSKTVIHTYIYICL